MTVIAVIISKKGIAVSTDSMLSALNSDDLSVYLEWAKSKIIPMEKLKSCISYWGLAGVLAKVPKKGEFPVWKWKTYDWLKEQSLKSKNESLEDFTKHLTEKLEEQIYRLGIQKKDQGIGIHVTGYENIKEYLIPELFLISNFSNTRYDGVCPLKYSRHTYKTMKNIEPAEEHREEEYRFLVRDFLRDNNFFTFNNGDPTLYNLATNNLFKMFQVAKERGKLKDFDTIDQIVKLVRRPVEFVSELQRDFFKSDQKLVGGKIHDMAIDNRGIMSSTSGDI